MLLRKRFQIACSNSALLARFCDFKTVLGTALKVVLASIAAQNFALVAEHGHVRQIVEQLQSTVYFARSEALQSGGRVVIKKPPINSNGCTTAADVSEWNCDWIVYFHLNGNGNGNGNGSDNGNGSGNGNGNGNGSGMVNANAKPTLQRMDTNAKVHIIRKKGRIDIDFRRQGLVDMAWI